MKNNISTEDRRGSFYWIDNKPYVSVTKVLTAISKPALQYWFGKEVYLAMVQDPTLSEKEALSAPYKTSDKAKARGTTIHSIVEAYKKSGIQITPELEQFKGYAEAFHKWVKDNGVEIVENERTVISKTHGYAGTLDLLVKKNGETWICDVKTGKDIYQEAYLQLSAYKHALEEDSKIKVDRTGVILLQENGNYKFAEGEDYFEVFMATKKLWEFINKEDLEKIKYEGQVKLL